MDTIPKDNNFINTFISCQNPKISAFSIQEK